MHVVCKWIGNSHAVAVEHYLQVTEAHLDAATGGSTDARTAALHQALQSAFPCDYTASSTLNKERETCGKFDRYSAHRTRAVAEAGVEPARGLPLNGF